MAESVCLRRSFSNPSAIIHGFQEGDSARALGESASFGRYMTESLSWERWSAFSRNRYLEEVEKYSKPGSVAKMKAFFEAHYSRVGAKKRAAQEEANKDINKIENSLHVEETLPNCHTTICEIGAKRRSILDETNNESSKPKVENLIESFLSSSPDKTLVEDHTPVCEIQGENTVDLETRCSSNASFSDSLLPVHNVVDKDARVLESRVNDDGIIDGSFEIQVHECNDVKENRAEVLEKKVSDVINHTQEKKLLVKDMEKKNSTSNQNSADLPLKQQMRKTEDSTLKQHRRKNEDSDLKQQRRKTEDSPLKQQMRKTEDSTLKQSRKIEDLPLKQQMRKTEDSTLKQSRKTEDLPLKQQMRKTQESALKQSRKTEDSTLEQQMRKTEDSTLKQMQNTEDSTLKQQMRKTEDIALKQSQNTEDSTLKQQMRKTEDSPLILQMRKTEESPLKQQRRKTEDSPLKQTVKSNLTKLSSSMVRLSTPVRPKMEGTNTPDERKSGKESVDKRKSGSRLANVSTNTTDVKKTSPMSSRKSGIRKIFTPLGKIIRSRFTSPAPSKESRNSVARHPCVTPRSEVKRSKVSLEKSFSRSKTLDHNLKSPVIGNTNSSLQSTSVHPFKLRTEERAAKRREFQKRLDKEAETSQQPPKVKPEISKSSLGVNLKASALIDMRTEVVSDNTKKTSSPRTLIPKSGSKPPSDQKRATFSQTPNKTITSKLGSEKGKRVSTESSSKLRSEKSKLVSTQSSSKPGLEKSKPLSVQSSSSSKLGLEESKPVSIQSSSSSKLGLEESKPLLVQSSSSSKLGFEKSKPVSVQSSSSSKPGLEKSKPVSVQSSSSSKPGLEKSKPVSVQSSSSSKPGLEKSKPVSVQSSSSSKPSSSKSTLVSTQPNPKMHIEKRETVSSKSSTMPPIKKWVENTSPNIF